MAAAPVIVTQRWGGCRPVIVTQSMAAAPVIVTQRWGGCRPRHSHTEHGRRPRHRQTEGGVDGRCPRHYHTEGGVAAISVTVIQKMKTELCSTAYQNAAFLHRKKLKTPRPYTYGKGMPPLHTHPCGKRTSPPPSYPFDASRPQHF